MTKKDLQSFDIRFPVAFGSGLATALLFVSARQQGALVALLLASLSPLPIMIATLGFGDGTGLGAAVVGAITIVALIAAAAATAISAKVLITAGLAGLIFAVGVTLPTWWLARLASSGRRQVIVPFFRNGITRLLQMARHQPLPEAQAEPPRKLAYPFGDILISAAAIAVVVVVVVTLVLIYQQPSYEAGLAKAVAAVEPLITEILGPRELPKNIDLALLSRLVVKTMPATASALAVLVLMANLWLAGRVVQLSHRLAHPWPNIAHELRVPRSAAVIFFACLGMAFLHGPAGLIASVAAAALGLLFVLQGLAVVHDLSRGMKLRTSLLSGLYLALALLMPWPLVIFALIGLVEAGFSLRDRKAAAASKNI
ncbi:MAG: YybS family protein [Methylovirgula sp.]